MSPKDPMMQPCRRGCGELVHLENDGFHVCRTSNEWGGVEKLAQQRNDALAEVERLTRERDEALAQVIAWRHNAQALAERVASETTGAWVSVTEREPPMTLLTPTGYSNPSAKRYPVLVATKEGRVFETTYTQLGFANVNSRTDLVTHWMPLPAHPGSPVEPACDGWKCMKCGHENPKGALRCQNSKCTVLNYSPEKASGYPSDEQSATSGPSRNEAPCLCGRGEYYHPWRFCDTYRPAKATAPSDKCEHGIPRQFCTAVHAEKTSPSLPPCECLLIAKEPSAYHALKCPRFVADKL